MLTKGEIAEMYRVKVVTIDRWMTKGMPFIKNPITGTVRFDYDAVKKWFKEGVNENDTLI